MHVHVLGCVRARALVCTQAGQYLRPLLEPCLVLINPCTTHRRPCTSPECKPEPRTPELCGTEIETAASLVESRIGMARRDRNRSHRLTSEYCIAPFGSTHPMATWPLITQQYGTPLRSPGIPRQCDHSGSSAPQPPVLRFANALRLCRRSTEPSSATTRSCAVSARARPPRYYHLRHSYDRLPRGAQPAPSSP